MKKHYKPFRLINSSELATITQRLTNALDAWNEQHALFALTSTMQAHPIHQTCTEGYCFTNEQEQPLAFVRQTDLSLIKQATVGETSNCFDSLALTLLTNLLQTVLGVTTLTQQLTDVEADNWFYRGAPTLTWTLHLGKDQLAIFLLPSWVLQQITTTTTVKPKTALQAALATQLMHGQVALKPIHLKVKDVVALRVGDVISTEHPLTQALELTHKNQSICEVHIGASNQHKTIQIKSSK